MVAWLATMLLYGEVAIIQRAHYSSIVWLHSPCVSQGDFLSHCPVIVSKPTERGVLVHVDVVAHVLMSLCSSVHHQSVVHDRPRRPHATRQRGANPCPLPLLVWPRPPVRPLAQVVSRSGDVGVRRVSGWVGVVAVCNKNH